jgi:hypothetical protein
VCVHQRTERASPGRELCADPSSHVPGESSSLAEVCVRDRPRGGFLRETHGVRQRPDHDNFSVGILDAVDRAVPGVRPADANRR